MTGEPKTIREAMGHGFVNAAYLDLKLYNLLQQTVQLDHLALRALLGPVQRYQMVKKLNALMALYFGGDHWESSGLPPEVRTMILKQWQGLKPELHSQQELRNRFVHSVMLIGPGEQKAALVGQQDRIESVTLAGANAWLRQTVDLAGAIHTLGRNILRVRDGRFDKIVDPIFPAPASWRTEVWRTEVGGEGESL